MDHAGGEEDILQRMRVRPYLRALDVRNVRPAGRVGRGRRASHVRHAACRRRTGADAGGQAAELGAAVRLPDDHVLRGYQGLSLRRGTNFHTDSDDNSEINEGKIL